MSETIDEIELGGLGAAAVGDRARAPVVMALLHGFQMEPEDLAPFARSMRVPAWCVFPRAPLPAEPRGRAWWTMDLAERAESIRRGPRSFHAEHPPGLAEARAGVEAFLSALRAAAGPRPLVFGGFSQGGMIACDTLLRCRVPVEALVMLSSSRIAVDEWEAPLGAGRVRGLPVLVSHGEADEDLAFGAGEALRDSLGAAGAEVTWVPFAEGHLIPLVVWRNLRKLLMLLAQAAGR